MFWWLVYAGSCCRQTQPSIRSGTCEYGVLTFRVKGEVTLLPAQRTDEFNLRCGVSDITFVLFLVLFLVLVLVLVLSPVLLLLTLLSTPLRPCRARQDPILWSTTPWPCTR
ncbi:hypothetical protein BDV19DRAFT_256418 [Aspergillus venezuelensis]